MKFTTITRVIRKIPYGWQNAEVSATDSKNVTFKRKLSQQELESGELEFDMRVVEALMREGTTLMQHYAAAERILSGEEGEDVELDSLPAERR